MKSPPVETAPAPPAPDITSAERRLRATQPSAVSTAEGVVIADGALPKARPLGPALFDWSREVRSVLVVRLRSLGDTVLATPTLYALRRFLPHARIDVLLEDWVAPLLDGCADVDHVLTVKRGSALSRTLLVPRLRAARYDVAFNLHGGTTATFLVRASGARHRIGYADYRYAKLYNHRAPSSASLWNQEKTHSVEQQLALPGWAGVPVSDRPPTRLPLKLSAVASVAAKLAGRGLAPDEPYALLHPTAAFQSKQWDVARFARVAEHLDAKGLRVVAVAAPSEAATLQQLARESRTSGIITFDDFSLPEVTALAARARLFVGNDSGIAHIAAAVDTTSVVVFGSSNVAHWRPWSSVPAEVVREDMPCAPCPGYTCSQFDEPECIRRVSVERVVAAVDRVGWNS